MKSLVLIVLMAIIGCISCASTKKNVSPILSSNVRDEILLLEDQSGNYIVYQNSRYLKNKNEFVVKRKLVDADDPSKKVLEKSISISTYGTLQKVKILRPKISQYHVWFDGKKYSTELKTNVEKKSMDIKLRSPEEKWNGDKQIIFPKGSGAFCYFSQMVECVAVTGFLDKAIEMNAGEFNFHVIWDGFPYFMEQYINVPPAVFAQAKLSYGGVVDQKDHRFSLDVAGQTIFYIFDQEKKFKKMLWVSQGVTLIKQ